MLQIEAIKISQQFKEELEEIFPKMTSEQRRKLNKSFTKFSDELFDLIFKMIKREIFSKTKKTKSE